MNKYQLHFSSVESLKEIKELMNKAQKLILDKGKLQGGDYLKELENFVIKIQEHISKREWIVSQKDKSSKHPAFEDLADSLTEGYWLEENGHLIYANKKFEEIFDVKRDQIYYTNFSIFDKIFNSDLDQTPYGQYTSTELFFNCKVKSNKNEERTLQIRLFPIANKEGPYPQKVGIARDITEIYQNEAFLNQAKTAAELKNHELEFLNVLLETSERKYKELIMGMSAGFAMHEMVYNKRGKAIDYIYIEVNKAFEEITGLKREYVVGRSAREIFPEIEEYWIDTYASVARFRKPVVFENYMSSLKKYFSVMAFSPGRHMFAIVFTDVTDRKDKELLVKANEEKFKLIIDHLPVAVAVINLSGDIDQINQNFTKLFSYSLDEIKTIEHWAMLAYPDKLSKDMAIELWITDIKQSLQDSSRTFTRISKILTRSGKSLDIEITFRLIEGKILATFTDLTERIRIEQELRSLNDEYQKINEALIQSNNKIFKVNQEISEAEERYRTVLETMADGVLVINSNGELVACNKAAEEIMEFNKKDFIGNQGFTRMWNFFQENGEPLPTDLVPGNYTLRTGESLNNMVVAIKSPQKSGKYISVNTRPLFDNSSKQPAQVVISFSDITLKKKTENALKSNERIIESLKEVIYGTVGEKFFETIVVALAKTLRASITLVGEFERGIPHKIRTICVCKDEKLYENFEYEIADTPCQSLFEGISCSYIDNLDLLFPKASFINHNLYKAYVGIPLHDSKGGIIGVLVALFNEPIDNIILSETILKIFAGRAGAEIERLEAEKELKVAKIKAEDSDRLKTAFLANMSHEIRTPMNGIIGFSNLLNNKNVTEEKRKKYVNIINNSANQLLTIISDILDVSKIEAGLLETRMSRISINSLLDIVKSEFTLDLKRKLKSNLKLKIKKPRGTNNLHINTDAVRLKQIISNLIGNSIKFTQEGHIEFGYEFYENNMLKFFVTDTGIGISEENQMIIFERFRQVENEKIISGTGLGLSISKGLVELLGGKIWINSKLGEGTTFFFTIPLNKN